MRRARALTPPQTALHLAAVIRSPALVRLLRAAGADETLKDHQGRRPVDCVAADDAATRAAFDAPVVAARDSGGEFESADDDERSADAASSESGHADADGGLARDTVEQLCAQLHQTFCRVDDIAAIDEMICFYAKELAFLKNRKATLERSSRRKQSSRSSSAAKADNAEKATGAQDDSSNSAESAEGDAEMLPLLKN